MLQTNEQETEREKGVRGFLKELGGNLLVLLGLFACLLLPSGIAVIGMSWIGSAGVIGWLVHLLLTLLVSWLLLAFLFCTLPRPVIVIMSLFNLLSTILLLCAAWAGERTGVDRSLVDPHDPKTTDQEAGEPPDPTPAIPVDVAAQGVRAGTRIGYGMGTITGLGIGAAVAALLTRYRHRD